MNQKKLPSLESLKIMALNDQNLFENIMADLGLEVIGTHDPDPLRKNVQEESVQSIASVLTESNEKLTLDKYRNSVKTMAEKLGYIVEVRKT